MLINKVNDGACQWNGHDVVISIDGVFFYRTLWAFSELVAAISAALHETFVLSKYANSVCQFCYIYKGFVRQPKAFPPSLCQFCACETSPGWGHLITWIDHSVGHLNGILARGGGNLNNNFQKSQMPGGGACWSFDLTDTLSLFRRDLFESKDDARWVSKVAASYNAPGSSVYFCVSL